MRFILVATSLLGLAAAAPGACRRKTSTVTLTASLSASPASGSATTASTTASRSASSSSSPSSVASAVSSSSASTSSGASTKTSLVTITPVSTTITTSAGPTSSSTTSSSKSTALTTSSASTLSTSSKSTLSTSSASSSATTTSKASTSSTIASTTTANPTTSSTTLLTRTTTSTVSTATTSKTATTTSSVLSTTTVSSTSTVTRTTTTSASTTSKATTTSFTSTTVSTTTTSNPATASVTDLAALSWYDPILTDGTSGRPQPNTGYVCYAGPSSNFPARSTWISWENMWPLLKRDALVAIGDNSSEVDAIHDSILDISKKSFVDARVILAVIVLESTGNPRAACTSNGVKNCGLMQAYNSSSYDPNDYANSIHLMIQDGTQGTVYGPGLVQLLNGSPLSSGKAQGDLYATLRAYNSGRVNNANLSDGQGAITAYVSHIANYLQGWNGYGDEYKGCNFANPTDTNPSPPPS